MGNRQESMWYTLLVGAHTALRLLLMASFIHGAEGTTVGWATVSSICFELPDGLSNKTFVSFITEKEL